MSVLHVFIIAEAGVNHNGSISIAHRLIDEAKRIGADAIKFQTFIPELVISKYAEKADYQKNTTLVGESQLEMVRGLALNQDEHRQLVDHCKNVNIQFLSSPFDEPSSDFLNDINVSRFKIGSGELTNHPFLLHVAKKMRPIILSTGMATLDEVDEAVHVIFSSGNRNVTLLHCVTEYPAPINEVNLRAMLTMQQAFHLPVGYSDHTLGFEAAIAAVALGACVIEKHFTLDTTMKGPDHKASIEPEEFERMVLSIRNIEQALGDGIKNPTACEIKNISIARKSIVAARNIDSGETIKRGDIQIKRPGTGIAPKYLTEIIGKTTSQKIFEDEIITWDKII